jgi:hypothetical protein
MTVLARRSKTKINVYRNKAVNLWGRVWRVVESVTGRGMSLGTPLGMSLGTRLRMSFGISVFIGSNVSRCTRHCQLGEDAHGTIGYYLRTIYVRCTEHTMPLLRFNLLLRVATVILPLSLVVFLYERALVPLYGTGPTTFLLNKVILCAILVSALQPCRFSSSNTWLFTAVALTLAPNATYWTAVWTSKFLKDPVLGPALTHALVLGPLVFVLATFSMHDVTHLLGVLFLSHTFNRTGYGRLPSHCVL